MHNIFIDNIQLGEENPPFIIAEAGVHHNNSVDLAKEYIKEAKIAGADAIKFQTYKASKLTTNWAPVYWDEKTNLKQFDLFSERSLLSDENYKELFAYSKEVDILFLSTPFDTDSADLLSNLGMSAYKIASADLTYIQLIEHVAQFNKPILLSTGAATFDEIRKAVNLLKQLNAEFALLHCVLSYPTELKDANLTRISKLKEMFPELVIGYSDHTLPEESTLVCPMAVALGARIIEKHFSLDLTMSGDDHFHSVDTAGLTELVKNCKDAFNLVGTGEEIGDSEIIARKYARRSIVASKPIKSGSIIQRDDLEFKRPGTGLSPDNMEKIIGRKLIRDLEADELVSFDLFEGMNEE